MATDTPFSGPPSIERVEYGERHVPALLVQPSGKLPADGLPSVLIQHGYGAQKDDLLPLATMLVPQGFIVMLPDAWGHGERFPATGPNWMTQISADYFLEVVRHTLDDMSDGLTWLGALAAARDDQLILGGFSMGAIAALALGMQDARVKGLIAASGAALPDLLPVRLFGSAPPSEQSAEWARAHDATANIGRFAPHPLLIQHGSEDDMVPVAGAKRLYEVAKPLYAGQPDNLALMLYPHSHMVSERQIQDAVEWSVARFHPNRVEEAAS